MRKVRDIPKRNYEIYAVIVVMTLLMSVALFIIYNNKKNYENSIPILRDIVPEIHANDLDNYLTENNSCVLYFGVVTDDNSREVEEDLKKLIDRRKVEFVYVNLTDTKDRKSFFNSFNEKYSDGLTLNNYPAFVIIRNGKIFDIVEKGNRDLYIGDIEQLVDNYELGVRTQ